MHERVQLLDGAFEIDSAPGEGTTIKASFPIKRIAGTEAGPRSAATPG